MTVANLYTDSELTAGNGVTTAFTTRFLFSANSEVLVYLILNSTGVETLQTISTHYTLTGAGTGAAGTVTFLSAPSALESVKIVRDTALTQTVDYVEGTKFPAATHEAALDKLTRISQETNTKIGRSPQLPISSVNYPSVFPDWSASTGGYVLRVNTGGTALELVTPAEASLISTLTPTDGGFVVGDGSVFTVETDATARASLGLTIGTDVQAYSAALDAVTGTNTGDQNVFTTIAVSGQSNVVSDAASDTLTFVAGSNMTITTDAATDTITFVSAAGGAGAPSTATYITQTADAGLSNEQALGLLATGIVYNTTTTGVLSIATAGTHYSAPLSVNQNAHGFAVGDLLYLVSTTWTKAIASSAAAAEVLGIVTTVTDANNFILTMQGYITGLSGLTAGAVYFLSPSSAGLATTTEPSTIGQISKPVYVAVTTTTAIITNHRGIVI